MLIYWHYLSVFFFNWNRQYIVHKGARGCAPFYPLVSASLRIVFACDVLLYFCRLKAHEQADRWGDRQGDSLRTDIQVHPTVSTAASAHIYKHYLTNYKRNLIYPVIFYVCKFRDSREKLILIEALMSLHKYFVFHTSICKPSQLWLWTKLFAATQGTFKSDLKKVIEGLKSWSTS